MSLFVPIPHVQTLSQSSPHNYHHLDMGPAGLLHRYFSVCLEHEGSCPHVTLASHTSTGHTQARATCFIYLRQLCEIVQLQVWGCAYDLCTGARP